MAENNSMWKVVWKQKLKIVIRRLQYWKAEQRFGGLVLTNQRRLFRQQGPLNGQKCPLDHSDHKVTIFDHFPDVGPLATSDQNHDHRFLVSDGPCEYPAQWLFDLTIHGQSTTENGL